MPAPPAVRAGAHAAARPAPRRGAAAQSAIIGRLRTCARGRALLGAGLATALAACGVATLPSATKTGAPELADYREVAVADMPGLSDDDLASAWPALRASCEAWRGHGRGHANTVESAWDIWSATCTELPRSAVPGAMRTWMRARLSAWRIGDPRSDRAEGLLTGYYEPLLEGSRDPSARFRFPLLRVPDDLVRVELAGIDPELAGKRLRGRIDTSTGMVRVLPYWSRDEIRRGLGASGAELFWTEDPLEAFFLQVQGSGRVHLESGETVRVRYADTNGQPYRSIGKWLVDHGEMDPADATKGGIETWARAHPDRVDEMLAADPSVVFFTEQPLGDPAEGPVGAAGVPLTPGISVAADPRAVPLGAPLVLSARISADGRDVSRLVVAQDTGGAIRGPLRFDLFFGTGHDAGERAGVQRAPASAWLLLPRGITPLKALATR